MSDSFPSINCSMFEAEYVRCVEQLLSLAIIDIHELFFFYPENRTMIIIMLLLNL